MNFHIDTFGCTANFGNSNELAEILESKGHVQSPLESADLVIVNTCAVTAKTERRMIRLLHGLEGDKLVIAGCLPAALPESLKGVRCLSMEGILCGETAERIAALKSDIPNTYRSYGPAIRDSLCGIVNISEGCQGNCSYCLVRHARKGLASQDISKICKKISSHLRAGMVEIQLTAQDTAAFGLDMDEKTNLAMLLEKVSSIPGKHMIRVGMMNPKRVIPQLEELLDAFRSPRIYRSIHLPIQSGSDEILKSMNRGYSVADFIEIVSCFKRRYPNMTLTTDVIAGYPGETDEDMEKTVQVLKQVQPDKVNVTKYSSRPHTKAAKLYDMPDRIKKDRSRHLTRLWMEISNERNKRLSGRIVEALITERGKGSSMKARDENYVGIVLESGTLGERVPVKIERWNPFYVSGHICTCDMK